MSVDNKYKKHELRTHIYERPAMYIGTIEPTPIDTYIIDNSNKIIRKQISYIPGLFKIFDEALVNAIDHSVRTREEVAKGDLTINIVKNIKIYIISFSLLLCYLLTCFCRSVSFVHNNFNSVFGILLGEGVVQWAKGSPK